MYICTNPSVPAIPQIKYSVTERKRTKEQTGRIRQQFRDYKVRRLIFISGSIGK